MYDVRLFGLLQAGAVFPPYLLKFEKQNNAPKISWQQSNSTLFTPALITSNSFLPPGGPCNRNLVVGQCGIISDSGPNNCYSVNVTFINGGNPCIAPPPTMPGGPQYPVGGGGGGGGSTPPPFTINYSCPSYLTPQQCADRQIPVLPYLQFVGGLSINREPDVRPINLSELSFWDPNVSVPGFVYQQQPRPNFTTFVDAYPKDGTGSADMSVADVCNLIGGAVKLNYQVGNVKNACAIRVSRALNYSGVTIPNIPNQTWKGADNKYYFYRASHIYNWLNKTFGAPDIAKTTADGAPNGSNFSQYFVGLQNRGIYVMMPQDIGTFQATGHVTYWGGLDAFAGKNYFPAASKVYLWRLPQ